MRSSMNRLPAFSLLLLFVLCCWVTGEKSGLPEDVCSDQNGSQNQNGYCKMDELFEDTDCFETDAVQCPQGRLLGEGSVCLNRTADTVLSTCRSGGWVTDGAGPVLNRGKRWVTAVLSALSSIAPIIPPVLDFFSDLFGGGSSDDQPPPNRPPQIQCPADIVVVAEEGKTTAVVTWQTPLAGDPEGEAFSVQQLTGLRPGSEFPRGTDSISYRVRDAQGAADFCSFLVTVKVIECPETPYVTGGYKMCRPSRNIYGSICDYTCETGFKLTNGVSRTKCQRDGSWSHEFPSCQRISCGTPTEISGGQAYCYSEEYGGLCPIHCHPGFTSQTPFVRCTSDGTWTQALPCLDMQAPTFPNGCPPNQVLRSGPMLAPMTVTWDDPFVRDNSGLEARLKSDVAKGDKLAVGSHVIKISAMDEANNSASCSFVVTVEAKGCRPPVTPANSHITCTHGYVQGSQCTVTCGHGYLLLGNATVTCVDEDMWDNVEPSCESKQCPEPPHVDHGRYECKNGWSYRDSCSLICHPSYDVSGPSDVMCRDDATWSETAICRDNTPPVFPDGCVDNIEVYAARVGEPTLVDWEPPAVEDNTVENVTLSSSIQPGSQFNLGVSPVTYTAVDINSNEASCHFTVTVSTLSCGAPSLHQNTSGNFMLYTCRDGYVHGAECTLSCTHGFPLNGAGSIACERADNSFPPTMSWEWDVETGKPECIETRCKDLTAPTNGALACYTGNFGKECLMSCQENWDVPASSNGRFACPNDRGIWFPEAVPNCTERQVPGRIRLFPDLYYYTNSCSEATEELKQNFIDRILSSEWGGACSQTPSCTAQNVQVICGEVTRRRKRELRKHPRFRRNTPSHYIRVSFDIVVDYDEENRTSSEQYDEFETIKKQVYDKLKADASSGQLDIGSLTAHEYTVGFPKTAAECPGGTAFVEDATSKKLSCVGCSKGYYLSDAGQCQQCEVGSFSEVNNATSCTRCPAGWSTPTTGSASSLDCEEECRGGNFSPRGFAPCQPCPPGRFQSRDGATTCDLCPPSTWTNGRASDIKQCLPADAHLPQNEGLSVSTAAPVASLHFACFIHLDNMTLLTVNFTFNGSSVEPLVVHLGSSDDLIPEGDESSEPASVSAKPGVWSKLEVTVNPSTGNRSVSYNKRIVYNSTLSPQTALLSTEVTITTLEGRAIVSGLYATESPNVEEGNTSDCNGDITHNVLSWIVSPRLVQSPSVCDAVNDCASSPCSSHGVCVDQRGGYLCQCQDGWTGDTCHLPPGACYLHQCQNAATCVPGDNNYTCVCTEEFSGEHCELLKIHGRFGEWQPWSNCSAPCEGHQQRQRLCNNPPPQNDGNNCSEKFTQTQPCGQPQCAVNGQWSRWSQWSECSAECGGGNRTRTRECNNPPPQLGGDQCDGSSLEVDTCSTDSCPVPGGWSDWSDWTPCSVTCGNGSHSRDRSCDSPVPAHGGNMCSGDANETAACNLEECPVCSEIIRSAGTFLTCEEESSPYLKTCNLTCAPGYLSSEEFPLYRCGEITGHLWNGQSDRTTPFRLPSCSVLELAPAAVLTQYVPMKSGCDVDTEAVSALITENVKILPCLDNGCDIIVETRCQGQGEGQGRMKRNTEHLEVTVQMKMDFEDRITSRNANEILKQYVHILKLGADSAKLLLENRTETFFTVNLPNKIIQPDIEQATYQVAFLCSAGRTAILELCVPCAAGSMEAGGQCVLCPVGQYQDTPGSVSCKPCRERYAWDLPGASDVDQCIYPLAEDTKSTPTARPSDVNDNDNTTALACGIAIPLLLFLMISIIIGLLLCYRSERCKTYAVQKMQELKGRIQHYRHTDQVKADESTSL